jgi:small subunit ribosomal protein S14
MSTAAQEAKENKYRRQTKKTVKAFRRCRICGRTRGYVRMFDMCRIHFREYAQKGELPGVTRSSW